MYTENEGSPAHIACTQEGCDNVDVVWDWNSPRSKQSKKPQKRLILPQSPKIPVKRYPSNNLIQNFEKFRDELQALREAIAVPDHEESLVLSPQEEAEYKDVTDDELANNVPPLTQEICASNAPPSTQEIIIEGNDDMFNDSADEDLLFCTQRLEADLEAAMERNGNQCNSNLGNNPVKDLQKDQIGFNNTIFQPTNSVNNEPKVSFDKPLKRSNTVVVEAKVSENKVNFNQSQGFPRTRSENQFKNCRQAGKVEFHRTQSFESTVEYTREGIPQHKLNEIERKRKEALAKLELKRKHEQSDSPAKCSPEEIEKKRLHALAKLETKRQQDTIERKRQEALKRLEMSRKKNAVVVRSSLSTRL